MNNLRILNYFHMYHLDKSLSIEISNNYNLKSMNYNYWLLNKMSKLKDKYCKYYLMIMRKYRLNNLRNSRNFHLINNRWGNWDKKLMKNSCHMVKDMINKNYHFDTFDRGKWVCKCCYSTDKLRCKKCNLLEYSRMKNKVTYMLYTS